jgi:hypothetical protein
MFCCEGSVCGVTRHCLGVGPYVRSPVYCYTSVRVVAAYYMYGPQ